jgi:hypothetical protein
MFVMRENAPTCIYSAVPWGGKRGRHDDHLNARTAKDFNFSFLTCVAGLDLLFLAVFL